MATQDLDSSERRRQGRPTPVNRTEPLGTRDERGRFRQGHANVRAGRPKGSKDRIPRDFKRMITDMIAGTIQEDEEISLLDLLYTALRTGLQAPPPYSIGYVKLVAEIGRAKDKGGVGRGLTIVLPRGGGYDPMARPGQTPVIRIGARPAPELPAGHSKASTDDGLDDVLGHGEDRLEMIQDEPTPCPPCRGRGWRKVDGEAERCRMCDGRGTLGSAL